MYLTNLSPDNFELTVVVLGAVRLTRAKQSPMAFCILQSDFKKQKVKYSHRSMQRWKEPR